MAEEFRRTIHVKGVGHAVQAPDQVTISITLEAQDKDYARAVELIADKIDTLRKSVAAAGLNLDELKTSKFIIEPAYEYADRAGIGMSTNKEFAGYSCRHYLEVTFDFDHEKFNKALASLSDSLSNPDISVLFSLKDDATFKDKLLKSAAENARHQAEILTAASGVKLGNLLSIGCAPKMADAMLSETEISELFDDISSGYGNASEARPDKRIFIPEDIEEEISIDFYWEIID